MHRAVFTSIGLYLVAMLTAISVAGGIAITGPLSADFTVAGISYRPVGSRGGYLEIARAYWAGCDMVQRVFAPARERPAVSRDRQIDTGPPAFLPGWTRLGDLSEEELAIVDETIDGYTDREIGFGWPMPALATSVRYHFDWSGRDVEIRDGIAVSQRITFYQGRILPTRPLFPGLLVNSLAILPVVAGVWLLLRRLAARVRASVSRRRSYFGVWSTFLLFGALLAFALLYNAVLVWAPFDWAQPASRTGALLQSIGLLLLLCCPALLLLTIGSALLIAVPRTRSLWRLRRGRCWRCGHQLVPASDRCPECGAPRPAIDQKPR